MDGWRREKIRVRVRGRARIWRVLGKKTTEEGDKIDEEM